MEGPLRRLATSIGLLATLMLAAPARADIEFWYQNRSSVEVQGVLIGTTSGDTKAVYLRSGQGAPIILESDCWVNFARAIVGGLIIERCGGIEYEYRIRFTNISDRNDIYCEAALTFTVSNDVVSIYFRIINSARGRDCVTSGMTQTANDEGAWLELRMN